MRTSGSSFPPIKMARSPLKRAYPGGLTHVTQKLENRAVLRLIFHSRSHSTTRLPLMPEIDYELAHFFAWARARAYQEFDEKMKSDPSLDPNWTFSDIMQRLLEEYRRFSRQPSPPAEITTQSE